jgi:hypothetical protein
MPGADLLGHERLDLLDAVIVAATQSLCESNERLNR